ncbi:unnamed protein product [Trichobilharzia regenti]|nr:unnamed protein product [Trichobilharzia regenti]
MMLDWVAAFCLTAIQTTFLVCSGVGESQSNRSVSSRVDTSHSTPIKDDYQHRDNRENNKRNNTSFSSNSK